MFTQTAARVYKKRPMYKPSVLPTDVKGEKRGLDHLMRFEETEIKSG
jgi:hypothetical protein